MNKRPLSVIVIACLYIAVGAIGFAYDLRAFHPRDPFYDIVWIAVIHLLAIVCGVYMLRGSNWARWLAIVWIAFHVGVSVFDAWSALAIHTLLLAAFAYFLFRPDANRYFRSRPVDA